MRRMSSGGACPFILVLTLLPLSLSLPFSCEKQLREKQNEPCAHQSLRRAQIRLHLVEKFLDLRAFEPGDVILIFKEYAKRVRDSVRIERHHVELDKGARPVERL